MADDGLSPSEIVQAIRLSVERAGSMPSDMSIIEKEPGEDDNTKLPVLTIQPLTEARLSGFNTDLVGYVTDSNGNQTGRIFHSEYQLDIQIDVWVADGSKYSERNIGNNLYNTLYRHDTKGPNKPFKDKNGNDLTEIWRVRVSDGQSANDLTTSPALRRWRQDISVWSYHRFDTTESYISGVNYPNDISDTDGDGTLTN